MDGGCVKVEVSVSVTRLSVRNFGLWRKKEDNGPTRHATKTCMRDVHTPKSSEH